MARLTPITSKDQVAAEDAAVVDAIVASRGAVQGPFTMFLHCPELAGRVAHLGAFIRFEGSLDMRVRVLAAMTVARELGAVYVWGAQTGGARRLGVPEATITAIREQHTRGIAPEDAQIVEFTHQLIRKHRVDDASVKALQERFGNDGLIQLTGTIGYYSMLAMTVNTCELEAGPGAEVPSDSTLIRRSAPSVVTNVRSALGSTISSPARAFGHSTLKPAPPSLESSTTQRPPVAWTIAFPIARPSPEPPGPVVARWKRSNMRSRSSTGTPGPLSSTRMNALPSLKPVRTLMAPLSGV